MTEANNIRIVLIDPDRIVKPRDLGQAIEGQAFTPQQLLNMGLTWYTLTDFTEMLNNEDYPTNEFSTWVTLLDDPEPEPTEPPRKAYTFHAHISVPTGPGYEEFESIRDEISEHLTRKLVDMLSDDPDHKIKFEAGSLREGYLPEMSPNDVQRLDQYERMRTALWNMATLYSEHRTDVTQMLTDICETGTFDASGREHRFVRITIPEGAKPGDVITYDTCTTLPHLVRISKSGRISKVIESHDIVVNYED